MRFNRYSAISIFGAPLEKGHNPSDPQSVTDLMHAYGIEADEVPSDPTDITPYYWRRPAFRYFLSMAHPEGPAVVELLPVVEGSENYTIGKIGPFLYQVNENIRRIEIPTLQPGLIIGGPSPRYPDKICAHELITFTE